MLQRIKDLMSFKETALCCGRLVLQKRKDLLSFYNGPAFAVLVKFRIACFRLLHYWRTTTRWPRNAERSKDTGRQLLQARCNQSRGTSLKDNTQTKLRSDSANVTASFLITNTKFLSCGVRYSKFSDYKHQISELWWSHHLVLLRPGIPSGMCAKLHNVAASNNRDHARNLSYYCLLTLLI